MSFKNKDQNVRKWKIYSNCSLSETRRDQKFLLIPLGVMILTCTILFYNSKFTMIMINVSKPCFMYMIVRLSFTDVRKNV